MHSVTVEKNQKSAPTPVQLTKAMTEVGGSVSSVEGNNTAKTMAYTRIVNHNSFQNKLEEIAHGNKVSWNFVWADSIARAINMAEDLGLNDYAKSALLLNAMVAATTKSVKIQIDSKDLTLLKNSKYRLCFAKKVGDNAYNVVWQSYSNYLTNNTFSWTPQYELFGSNYFEEKVQVDVSTNVVRIGLGETSILDTVGLLGAPVTGGPSTSITLYNDYGPIHPGINQLSQSSLFGPAVSTPIYVAENPVVLGETELTPVEKVLVWFEQNIETSTMFSMSRSKAVEIDLTFVDSVTRLYANGGWVTPPTTTIHINGNGNGSGTLVMHG